MALGTGAKIGLLLVVLVLGTVGAAIAYTAWALGGAAADDPVELRIVIPPGSNAERIGEVLGESDVVRSSLAFRLRARSRGLDRHLQAGEYVFHTGMTVDGAIDVLLAGPDLPEGMRFTIPEGLTIEETLERLAEQTFHTVEDYRAVLDAREVELPGWVPDLDAFGPGVREPYEGLLFPETYEVGVDASAQHILQRMVDQLARIFDNLPTELHESAAQRELSRYEMLKLASIVERETRLVEELRTVSGVLHNRMGGGMRLEVDAALLYAVNQRGVRVGPEIRRVDSPYNLYENDGLPPTPIGAPGRRAIEAAYDPEEHNYRYYAKIDDDGTHAFAETFEEHQRNVQRLRELQREAEQGDGS